MSRASLLSRCVDAYSAKMPPTDIAEACWVMSDTLWRQVADCSIDRSVADRVFAGRQLLGLPVLISNQPSIVLRSSHGAVNVWHESAGDAGE